MSRTITLDKHEMVVDREDFEALEAGYTELLEACKRAIGCMTVDLPLDAIERAKGILYKAIAKAELTTEGKR